MPALVLLALCGCLNKKWVPTGGWQGINKISQCESIDLERRLSDPTLHPQQQMRMIQEFMKRCKKDITRDSSGAYTQMYKFSGIQYEYLKSRIAEPIEYLDFEGNKLRLVLFMKQDSLERPLVIVKCGLQCNQGSTTFGITLMNLYDEGPFHVLLVPNITGSDFQRDNGIMPLGGFDEGRQILKLAQWVQSSGFKYHKKVSEVHVLGVSLGASSALYAALYASFNRRPSGDSYISSTFVGCPVVDLEKSVQELYSGGIVSQIFKRVFWRQMQMIANDVPIIREIVGEGDIANRHDLVEIEELITRGALNYYKNATVRPNFNFAPFLGARINNRQDLWDLNRFQTYADQVNLPVYVWAADNDKVVNAYRNADLLKGRENYNLIRTPKGNHCMFSDSYSWKIMGAITRGILVSRSRNLYTHLSTQYLPLDVSSGAPDRETENWFAYDASRKRRGLQWQAVAGSDKINLIAYGIKSCLKDYGSKKLDRRYCKKGSSLRRFSLDAVGLTENDRPSSELAAQSLTRWLNSNVWVWGSVRGRLLPEEAPQQIEIRSFGQRRVY